MNFVAEQPPYPWRTVRVFISSTFRDFHAERDYLVKYVFPDLRRECERWHLHLVDVDLRWGVTQQAAESAQVVETCLSHVDECRPFFLCLLGARYGWVPRTEDIPEETRTRYAQLADRVGYSITHLELAHATFDPLRAPCSPIPAGEVFFYLRDDSALPAEDTLTDYSESERSEYIRSFCPAHAGEAERVGALKAAIRQYHASAATPSGGSVYIYRPSFDPRLVNPEDPSLRGRLTVDSLREFGQRVRNDVASAIVRRFEARIAFLSAHGAMDPLDAERDSHASFVAQRTRLFVGRKPILARLKTYIEGDSRRTCCLVGAPGAGKSALLSQMLKDLASGSGAGATQISSRLVISHMVGASAQSAALDTMLRRLCQVLFASALWQQRQEKLQALAVRGEEDAAAHAAIEREYEIPHELATLAETFGRFLGALNLPALVVIDGLNQIDPAGPAFVRSWLPTALPGNVKLIVSTTDDYAQTALRDWDAEWLHVKELLPEERSALIRGLPSLFAKTIDDDLVSELLKNPGAANPLYLAVAMNELRVFGSRDLLADKIRCLPVDNVSMFVSMLDRLAEDTRDRPGLVEAIFCLLEAARHGLTEAELEAMVAEQNANRTLQAVLRQSRDFLQYRGDEVLSFYHDDLSRAVRQRYWGVPDRAVVAAPEASRRWHKRLAEYFLAQPLFIDSTAPVAPNARKLSEQPWHAMLAGDMWDSVVSTLCDVRFVEAKIRAELIDELRRDYEMALERVPDHPCLREEERKQAERVAAYTEHLIAFARRETGALATIRSDVPMRAAEVQPLHERVLVNPSPRERLTAFACWLESDFPSLHKFGRLPGHCLQQAYNSADSGPVVASAETVIAESNAPLLLRQPTQRPAFNAFPGLLRTIESGGHGVTCVRASHDASVVVFVKESRLRHWDSETGITRSLGMDYNTSSVDLTPDGRIAVSGCWGGELRIWSLDDGRFCAALPGHSGVVLTVRVAADGRFAVSGSADKTIRIWDLQKRACVRVLSGHTGPVNAVDISADCETAISGSGEHFSREEAGEVHIWELNTGRCVASFAATSMAVCMTPDGKTGAFATDLSREIAIVDLETRQIRALMVGHSNIIRVIAITPDGRFLVSGAGNPMRASSRLKLGDYGLRVWQVPLYDLRTAPLKTLAGHWDGITSLCVTPDGRRAISASDDGSVRIWDLFHGFDSEKHPRSWRSSHCVKVLPGGVSVLAGSDNQNLSLLGPESRKKRAAQKANAYSLRNWDLKTGACVRIAGSPADITRALSVSPDGSKAVAGFEGFRGPWFFDLTRGVCTRKGRLSLGSWDKTAFTPDGTRLLAIAGKRLRVCDAASGRRIRNLGKHRDSVTCFDISLDGRLAATGSGRTGVWDVGDHTIRVWDLASGVCVRLFWGHTEAVASLRFTPDGRRLVSGAGLFLSRSAEGARIWDIERGECFAVLDDGQESADLIRVTPDGRFVVTASSKADGIIRVWHLETGKLHCRLEAHEDWIKGCVVSPDGTTLISAGVWDNTVRVWDIETGRCLGAYIAPSRICALANLHPNGMWALGTEGDDVVLLQARHLLQTPIATPTRGWQHGPCARWWRSLFGNQGSGWQSSLNISCPWCGRSFALPGVSQAGSGPAQSETPTGAVFRTAPGSGPYGTVACPHCKGSIATTSFFVDRMSIDCRCEDVSETVFTWGNASAERTIERVVRSRQGGAALNHLRKDRTARRQRAVVERIIALQQLSNELTQRDPDSAILVLDELARLCAEVAHGEGLAFSLFNQAVILSEREQFNAARQLFARAAMICAREGDKDRYRRAVEARRAMDAQMIQHGIAFDRQ